MANPYAGALEDGNDSSRGPAIPANADQIKAKANEAIDAVTAEAKKAMADPEKYARDSYDSVAAYTRDQPVKALAIAAGVAFIFGALSKSGK